MVHFSTDVIEGLGATDLSRSTSTDQLHLTDEQAGPNYLCFLLIDN